MLASMIVIILGVVALVLSWYLSSQNLADFFAIALAMVGVCAVCCPPAGNLIVYSRTVTQVAAIEKLQDQQLLLAEKISEIEPKFDQMFNKSYPEYERNMYSQFNGGNWFAQMVGVGLPNTKTAEAMNFYATQYRELKDEYYKVGLDIAKVKSEIRADLRNAFTMSVFMPIDLDDPMIQVVSSGVEN